jgi:hypothetical protein
MTGLSYKVSRECVSCLQVTVRDTWKNTKYYGASETVIPTSLGTFRVNFYYDFKNCEDLEYYPICLLLNHIASGLVQVIFEVLISLIMKTTVFCDAKPSTLVGRLG